MNAGDRANRCVLVVDDEPSVRTLLRDILEPEGLRVVEAATGRAALEAFRDERPDIVLLDVVMPEMDGWTTLERLRDVSDVPVIMLTSRTLEWERVRGLRAGADDYVVKPFSPIELSARVVALLRRTPVAPSRRQAFDDGVVRVDFDKRSVTVRGAPVSLTPLEFRMLSAFVDQADRVLSRDELLELVWGSRDAVFPEQVKLYVGYLRRKLGAARPEDSPIETVRGFGYRFRRSSSGRP